ncbi:hypothetical protein QR680_001048 [Steinernema hermaphroditum]|uniref:3-phosphoinositide-dependent protein kinase 1 n=1 Tax=Steinernema hermaphroditum TaxID=289476 RepID=A0AA39GWT1_9BILA|nr:hypothetical protein QR680_001048 [Steinernema hermaphroditum]
MFDASPVGNFSSRFPASATPSSVRYRPAHRLVRELFAIDDVSAPARAMQMTVIVRALVLSAPFTRALQLSINYQPMNRSRSSTIFRRKIRPPRGMGEKKDSTTTEHSGDFKPNPSPPPNHDPDGESEGPATKKFAADVECAPMVSSRSASSSQDENSDNGESSSQNGSQSKSAFNNFAKQELTMRGYSQTPSRTANDFYFMQLIGEGTFSHVFRCREVNTGKSYAVKVLSKTEIVKRSRQNYVSRERNIMAFLTYVRHGHPFLVHLYCTFQDADHLFFAMTLADRGDLYRLLKNVGRLPSSGALFYASEIVCGLTYMHQHKIAHRDLKPENVLIGGDGHILISDFETAKFFGDPNGQRIINEDNVDDDTNLLEEARGRQGQRADRSSFVGTAQYISPEVVQGKSFGPECDYWALGAIMCQMLSGRPPFYGENDYKTMERIIRGQYAIPSIVNSDEKAIISEFLIVDKTERLGSLERGGHIAVMEHPYFADVDFDALPRQTPPRFGSEPCLSWTIADPPVMQTGLSKEQLKALILDFDFDLGGGVPLESFHSDSENEDGTAEGSAQSTQGASQQSQGAQDPPPVHTGDFKFTVNLKDRERRLQEQAEKHEFHSFVDGELILKSGRLDKKRKYFARRREFLLTTGPFIYYVDPFEMVLKGKITITRETEVIVHSFKKFTVRIPNRDYILSDPQRRSTEWRAAIYAVRDHYFPPSESSNSNSPRS